MAISELQMGLIAVGVAAVVGVVAYNKWQESRHRRQAEEAFGEARHDVLLEPGLRGGGGDAEQDAIAAPGGVTEPAFRAVREEEGGRGLPTDPPQASGLADCVLRIESIEALPAARLAMAAVEAMGDIPKPMRLFGFDDLSNLWVEIHPQATGSHHWFAAVLQLVDRRGPVSETDLLRFFDGLQQVADQFLAVPAGMPARAEVMARANSLDSFCASVDVQIGLNVVASEQAFPGTKIRAYAESQGWLLGEDGSYYAVDTEGQPLFAVSNLDGAAFAAQDMRDLQTRGITLLLDVPRTRNGRLAFDRMLGSARQLADSMRGEVVDDNRAAFGAAEAHVIRSQVEQFQGRMESQGVTPGSELAQRLFAA